MTDIPERWKKKPFMGSHTARSEYLSEALEELSFAEAELAAAKSRIRELEQEKKASLWCAENMDDILRRKNAYYDQACTLEEQVDTLQAQLQAVTQQLIIARAYVQEWADHWSTREQIGIVHTVRNSLNEIDDVLRKVGHDRTGV